MLNNLRNAGKPLYGFLLLKLGWQSELLISAVKTVSPTTRVMLRGWRNNEPGFDWLKMTRDIGRQYAVDYFRTWVHGDNLLADYHQVINEPGGDIYPPVQVADFWHGVMDVAKEFKPQRLHLGIGCFSERNPALPTDANRVFKDYWTHPATHAMLRRAKNEGHVLMLHEYVIDKENRQGTCYPWTKDGWQESRLYRHQLVYRLLPADLQDLPLWIGEVGDLSSLQCGITKFVDNLRLYMDAVAGDDYLKVAALWTVGKAASKEWEKDQLNGHLYAISDLLIKG